MYQLFTSLTSVTLMFTVLAHSTQSVLLERADPSPDFTCGVQAGGTYECSSTSPCCSVNGYCGTGDEYCLTTAGCQSAYSAPNVTSCYEPVDKVTISPDGTCGKIVAGLHGYRCPTTGNTCCSSFGYCGNTSDHCDATLGCQSDYGCCGTGCSSA